MLSEKLTQRPDDTTASLWIDTDMGFDDMQALLMIKASGRSVAGCSLQFGCAQLDQVIRNSESFFHTFDWKVPLFAGAHTSLQHNTITAAHVLGDTGMPTLGKSLPSIPDTVTTMSVHGCGKQMSAVEALCAWLENAPENAEILALGPLTNIAGLIQTRPDLLRYLSRLTWMGGAATRGNQTKYAEFNAFADPEAAAIVCNSAMHLRMIDLDTCRQVTVDARDLNTLKTIGTDKAELLHDLFGGYINIGLSRGRQSMALYDPVAAASIIDENTVTYSDVSISVEPSGADCAGRTVVNRHVTTGNRHQIGKTVDATRVRTLALEALYQAAI